MSKEENAKKLLEFLSDKCCEDCKIADLRVLTFDHLNPKTKKATVSTLVHKGFSWSVIMKEIKKCSIVCNSCHVRRECIRSNSIRQQFWTSLNEKGSEP